MAKKPHILIVDDEPSIRLTLETGLSLKGFRTSAAINGREAVSLIKNEKFDLVICDLKMPRVDGMAFYRMLSAAAPGLSKRVIFVTGDVAGTDRAGFLGENGCR